MGRKYRNSHLTIVNRHVDFVKQLVTGFHVLAVQKGTQTEHGKVVIQQPGDCFLGVDTTVINEHVAVGGKLMGNGS